MTKKEAPVGVAPGSGAGDGKQVAPQHLSKNHANALASNVVAFTRRVPQCEHCGWLVPPGSATEAVHHRGCVVPRQEAAARAERIAAYREQCRETDRRRLAAKTVRPAIGPRRAVPAPLPPRQPHKANRERLERLSMALADRAMHVGLVALTRLPLSALERIAQGKSTMTRDRWRRVEALIGRAGR